MLLVGYGYDNTAGEKFWLIKKYAEVLLLLLLISRNILILFSQWGTSWGEGGYLRVSREVANNCGISTW
jgi:hypothetical protein